MALNPSEIARTANDLLGEVHQRLRQIEKGDIDFSDPEQLRSHLHALYNLHAQVLLQVRTLAEYLKKIPAQAG